MTLAGDIKLYGGSEHHPRVHSRASCIIQGMDRCRVLLHLHSLEFQRHTSGCVSCKFLLNTDPIISAKFFSFCNISASVRQSTSIKREFGLKWNPLAISIERTLYARDCVSLDQQANLPEPNLYIGTIFHKFFLNTSVFHDDISRTFFFFF